MAEENFRAQSSAYDVELLLRAAASGSLEDVRVLVSRGCDINQSDFKGSTPLIVAVKAGHKELVKFLCDNCADVNQTTKNGETALYIACDNVKRDIVDILLVAGSDVDIQTNGQHPQTGRTPLMAALPSIYEINFKNCKKSEAVNIVKMLLSCRCDIDARDWKGNTALHLAADQNDIHTVCLLAENGANLHIRNKYGKTAFEDAIQPNKQRYGVAAILLLYGYDMEHVLIVPHPLLSVMNGIDHSEAKYFHASRIPRKVLLDLLLNAIHINADLEDKITNFLKNCTNITTDDLLRCRRFLSIKRPTSLQHLCRFVIRKAIGKRLLKGIRQLPVAKSIKHFLALDVDIDTNDPLKIAELNTAVTENDIEKLKLLVNNQINVNCSFSEHTPLTEASGIGTLELCKVLLENGADVDLHDNVGMTALHCAAAKGHDLVVEELLNHNADGNRVDIFCGENALIKAASNGHFTTMILLVEQGFNPCLPNEEGISAIHFAAESGNVSATEALLVHGVSPDTRDRNQNTPLHVAASRCMLYTRDNYRMLLSPKSCSHYEVTNLLLRAGADKAALNDYNKSPFEVAVEYSNEDIAVLLNEP